MLHLVVALSLLCYVSAQSIPTTDDRIVGGTETTIVAHPYQVSLQLDGSHFCGGSLHSKTIIVTAAHCVKAVESVALSRLQVRLGSKFWNSGGVLRGIAKMKINPNFNPNLMIYDVALIKLDSPVVYSDSIQNISLQVNDAVDGADAIVTGWGTLYSGATSLPSILRKALLKLILRDTCASAAYNYSTAIKETMICAAVNGKDSCQGDSGGPLVSVSTGRLVGIVSWGNGCAQKGYPGVYSYVVPLRNWIINNAPTL